VISAVQSLVDHGYLKASEIGDKVFGFFVVNWQFIIYLAIAVIGYLAVKKILSVGLTAMQFINHANNSEQDVIFVPHGTVQDGGAA
jgi:uncharacterized membrane protein (DUF4010 family)